MAKVGEHAVVRLGLSLIALAAAVAGQYALAVEFHPDGYRFLRLDNKGKLVPFDHDDTFVPRRLPQGMTLTFDMDGTPAGGEANLILDPSGSLSAFTLTLRAGQASWLAQGQANGKIRSRPPGSAGVDRGAGSVGRPPRSCSSPALCCCFS